MTISTATTRQTNAQPGSRRDDAFPDAASPLASILRSSAGTFMPQGAAISNAGPRMPARGELPAVTGRLTCIGVEPKEPR